MKMLVWLRAGEVFVILYSTIVIFIHFFIASAGDVASVRNRGVSARRDATVTSIAFTILFF